MLRQALESAGLEKVRVEGHCLDWTFPSRDWIVRQAENLFRMFPSWSALAPAERDRLIAAALAALGDAEPPSVASTALFAIGQKPSGI